MNRQTEEINTASRMLPHLHYYFYLSGFSESCCRGL